MNVRGNTSLKWDEALGAFGRRFELWTNGCGSWIVRSFNVQGDLAKSKLYDNYSDAREHFLRYTTPVVAMDNEYEQEVL
jgi:hypothetical protein